MRLGLLTVHLVASVGWVGAAACYLVLGIVAGSSDEPDVVRAAWQMLETVGWTVVVPLAVGALVTGVAVSLSTAWGLVRHWWVVVSLVLTSVATLITVLHMRDVSETARRAATAPAEEVLRLGGDVVHPGAGLVVLLVVAVLNVYKPRGRVLADETRTDPDRRPPRVAVRDPED
ncbi:DUF2269 family protein [Actinomycetospora straminea]|uniref:Uncharacterized protein n=1 Tax=Actinomycetospora straminea TaxID=663607 RepID=A0ABP9E0J6_9PSEU|nr:DUF2269 family protein [Actinomycetospora straminea]MDD7934199.1 DUF2269 family protein [Actinomycetospora straminea]